MSTKKNVMTAADILRGGDSGVMTVEVEGLYKDGETALVMHRPVSAATMISFQQEVIDAQKAEEAGENPRHVERMVKTLVDHLCDEQGNLLFNEEQLKQAPARALVLIMKAITSAESKQGNPSSESEATNSDSHTDLQVT